MGCVAGEAEVLLRRENLPPLWLALIEQVPAFPGSGRGPPLAQLHPGSLHKHCSDPAAPAGGRQAGSSIM